MARLLDLGTGTGETLAAVLGRHAGRPRVGPTRTTPCSRAARVRLAGLPVELHVADLADPLPAGPFDLVVSALAVHHLEGPDKAALFARVAAALRPGRPLRPGRRRGARDPSDAVTPGTDDHDRPSTAADQLDWLADAGLDATVVWAEQDLVVLRADHEASPSRTPGAGLYRGGSP